MLLVLDTINWVSQPLAPHSQFFRFISSISHVSEWRTKADLKSMAEKNSWHIYSIKYSIKKVFFQFQKIAWCSAMTGCLLQNKLKEKKIKWFRPNFVTPRKGTKRKKPWNLIWGFNQSSWKEIVTGNFQMGLSSVILLNEVLGDKTSGLGHSVTYIDNDWVK